MDQADSEIIIRFIESNDIPEVSLLHLNYLKTSFSKNNASLKLLNLYYLSLIKIGEIALAAVSSGKIIGYVAFVTSIKKIYLYQLKNYLIKSLYYNIILSFLDPIVQFRNILLRIKQFFSFSNKANENILDKFRGIPELRPIVVDYNHQGKGVAKLLILKAEELLRAKNVRQYFLRVEMENKRAVRFYEKMEFIPAGHESPGVMIMVKNIS